MDYKLREQLREEFKNLFSKGLADETILIYSTTDPKETMELNGEVIVLDEGKVLQVGPAKARFGIRRADERARQGDGSHLLHPGIQRHRERTARDLRWQRRLWRGHHLGRNRPENRV